MIPWTKVWSPKYIKNLYDWTPGRQTIQLKNGQRTRIDTSPRKTYRGPGDIWKNVQHHSPSERWKLKIIYVIRLFSWRPRRAYKQIISNYRKYFLKNFSSKISDIPCSNILTDMSPKARDIKERINKWDLIKIKSFCMAKENSTKLQREPTVCGNIFANDTSDKGLISKIYIDLTRLHSRKTNNPIKKWAKDLNRHFSKGDIQRAQRHMKRCSASLVIREMQIKTTVRYHLTLLRMTS